MKIQLFLTFLFDKIFPNIRMIKKSFVKLGDCRETKAN